MRSIWNLISGFIVISLLVWFIQWYIKGHFGKWAPLFWLNTIISIIMFFSKPDHNPNWPQHDSTPAHIIWQRNVKNW